MKWTLLLLLGLLVASCASFPKNFGENKTFAYGGILFDNKDVDISAIGVRPVDQVIGFDSLIQTVGKNEFIMASWKPGKYYIDEIDFLVPNGYPWSQGS